MIVNLFRMVFNDHAFEILEKYRNGEIDIQQALTRLNNAVDYVLTNEEQNKENDNVIQSS
jgi:hypothetical protein